MNNVDIKQELDRFIERHAGGHSDIVIGDVKGRLFRMLVEILTDIPDQSLQEGNTDVGGCQRDTTLYYLTDGDVTYTYSLVTDVRTPDTDITTRGLVFFFNQV